MIFKLDATKFCNTMKEPILLCYNSGVSTILILVQCKFCFEKNGVDFVI